jgi:tRNA (guanosine-2'-O-)-methyltransferase
MVEQQNQQGKRPARVRADVIKPFRCKNLIAVIEDPQNPRNIGTVIRNVNALGVDKVYVVDPRHVLPDDWQELRSEPKLSKLSVSAIKWTFVKRFDSTEECLRHLDRNGFISIVTSPHVENRTHVLLHEGDYTKHTKLAVWFGNETRGISDLAVEQSELCVSIPMFGMVESFNLGTTSGIVLNEVARQRRAYQSKFRSGRKKGKRATPLSTIIESEA